MKKIVLACIIVAVGCLGLWFWARPAYRRHQEIRLVEQAKAYLTQKEYNNASLSARRALQINPRNLEACRVMADLAEKTHSPDALDWWRRIVEAEPSIPHKLQFASAALHSQSPPFPLATQILEELKGTATNLAAYHAISAELALRLKRTTVAAKHLEQACRLEPTNELHQLNLAVLQLESTKAGVPSAARVTLERLRASTNVGDVALRWLVAESLERNDFSRAARFSRQLLADPRVVMGDRLQHLAILRQSQSPEFKDYLRTQQRNATTNAAQVYALSTWMVERGLADDALTWLLACPAKLQAEQPVLLAVADCYMARKDWHGLDQALSAQNWGDREFLRFAFLARAATELNQKLAADARWRTAIRNAGDRLGPLTTLLTLATKWGQEQAREDLLWRIAQRFPRDQWALRELERTYTLAGNTLGLNKVYSSMASYAPQNFVAQNNLAATSLLLKLNLPRTHELARELFTQHPEQAVIASTYAYSLYLQNRTREGLAVLQKLKPEDLENPSVALYYGILLTAVGEGNKASPYLRIAQDSSLLPEEKILLAEALKRPGSNS
ncbi:MAG TPA: hypothetical protein PLV05_08090 [Verrucomicrobiota bacterium]|nr:hypothetical protein [Verrucomicrobiota bacterium]HRR64214.1 hypothetical protein [Candidatus Paceibacterota bacterium]HOF69885.1 hypothetical protein [Verrucomicrobiota bacterium]HOM44147.1 hypothetical protein [Verrucomicrobiota bacterium]HOQ54837.1 hypothetical protein [Verrucomicrobiota bacterium]